MLKLTHVNHLFRLSYGIWLNELKGQGKCRVLSACGPQM